MEHTGDGPVFEVRIDYALSFNEMVRAGKYDEVSSHITEEHFPVKGKGNVNVRIEFVQFSMDMSSEQVFTELYRTGRRPATIEELLALGSLYPELQQQFPIIALSSVWRGPDGFRRVAYLGKNSHKRSLCLILWSSGWSSHYHFAAVHT